MRILVLGMYGLAEGELSYEMRMIHHLAQIPGNEVDYWTDAPLSYSMEPVLKQPPTLRSFVFKEGKNALAKTPRQFHPQDVKRIIQEHMNERTRWPLGGLKIESIAPAGDKIQAGAIFDPSQLPKPYDIIFTTSQTGIDMGVWLRQVLGIPLVVQILDCPYWRLDQFGPWELYKESVLGLPLLPTQLFDGYRSEWGWWFSSLANVDRVTTILDVAKQNIAAYAKAFTGIDYSEKISVSYHGSVDTDTFDYYLQKEKVERKNQVLCLNRIDFHKGVDQTVLVCRHIQDLMGDKAPDFVFASRGNQDWYENLVKDFAKSNLRKVRFTGWIDNPAKIRLIRESKAVIDNEWPEGFGGCILGEAIYSGTQPFAWNRRSKKEVHPQGANLIEKGDFKGMAERVAWYLSGDYEETPQEARDFVKQFRSNKSHAESINKILQETLGR